MEMTEKSDEIKAMLDELSYLENVDLEFLYDNYRE